VKVVREASQQPVTVTHLSDYFQRGELRPLAHVQEIRSRVFQLFDEQPIVRQPQPGYCQVQPLSIITVQPSTVGLTLPWYENTRMTYYYYYYYYYYYKRQI